jgi:hypothetical protein
MECRFLAAVLGSVGLLAGCAAHSRIALENNEPGWRIVCSQMRYCEARARELCDGVYLLENDAFVVSDFIYLRIQCGPAEANHSQNSSVDPT